MRTKIISYIAALACAAIPACAIPLSPVEIIWGKKKPTPCSQPPSPLPSSNEQEKNATIQQLNQIIWVVSGVLSYNDVRFLEEAEIALSESSIDVSHMNDKNIVEIVSEIRKAIAAMRIDAGDRQILEQEISARQANIFWNSLKESNLEKIGQVHAVDPISCVALCAVNMMSSSAQSYAMYKIETQNISKDFKKKQWELDKSLLEKLSSLQTELFKAECKLAKEKGIDADYLRISVKDAQTLREQLKEGCSDDAHRYLTDNRTQQIYGQLPEYWYHRGIRSLTKANECKNEELAARYKDDARMCFEHYQKMFVSFRHSRDAVSVAAGMLKLLSDDYAKGDADAKRKMLRQAEIIEKYSDPSDLSTCWQDYFLLYTTYKAIGERDKAIEVLALAVSRLKMASDSMTQETLSKDIPQGTSRPIRSYARPLALCVQTLGNEYSELGGSIAPKYSEVIDRFIEEQYIAAQTQIDLAGSISEDKQAELVEKAIGTPPENLNESQVQCAIWEYHESENVVICQVPIKFFLTDEVDCEINFWSHDKQKWIKVYEWTQNRKYLFDKEKRAYAVQLEFKVWEKYGVSIEDVNKVRLDIMHERMPIGLVFSKQYRDPIQVLFGKKEGSTNRHDVRYRYFRELPVKHIKYSEMEDRF